MPPYAALDDQSMDDFNTQSLLQRQEWKARSEPGNKYDYRRNSVRSRRVNGLYIQDIKNLFNVFKVIFAYLQKKVTASQKDIATPENPGLGNI